MAAVPTDHRNGPHRPSGPAETGAELLADLDRAGAWVLLVDGVVQSHLDPDPRHLDLAYMRWLGHLADLAAPPGEPLRVLHLGGGGLTLARYVAATRPGSAQVAAESDARVAALAQQLPLPPPASPGPPSPAGPGPASPAGSAAGPPARPGLAPPPTPPASPPGHGPGWVEVVVGDARAVAEELPAGSFGLLIADAFTGARTPAHLTTVEFTSAAAALLAPHGVFAVNVADGPPLAHARARVAAVRSVFGHTCLIAEAGVLGGEEFGNLVVAGSRHPLPVTALAARAASGAFPARLLAGPALGRFAGGSTPPTDSRPGPAPALPPPEVLA
jgi:spermidine synthase